MTQVDTPDYQRGVVSAQKLLASVPSGTTAKAVYVPSNTETLVVVATEQNAISAISVTGNMTGVSCPLSSISAPEGSGFSPTWYADVSSVLDNAVTVSITFGVASAWYIYADSGVHMVSDTNKALNNQRVQYVIPIPPDTASGDHPYNELQFRSAYNVASGTNLADAPGAGKRFRVFSVQVVAASTGTLAWLADSVSNFVLCYGPSAGGSLQFGPSGLPISANAALKVGTTAGNAFAVAAYTNEAV